MNEQTFWEMLADGRLAALAKKNPLEFEHLYEKIVEQALADSGKSEQLRPYSDMLLIKLLWDTHPFEFQSELGQKQPELFALRRKIILNAFHRQHTDEKHPDRGKAIQWRVDREIERHATPLGACVALNRMMNESMWGEGGLRDALNMFVATTAPMKEVLEHKNKPPKTPPGDGVVLAFKPRQRS